MQGFFSQCFFFASRGIDNWGRAGSHVTWGPGIQSRYHYTLGASTGPEPWRTGKFRGDLNMRPSNYNQFQQFHFTTCSAPPTGLTLLNFIMYVFLNLKAMQVKEGNRNLNTSTKVSSIRVEFQIYDFWSLHKLYLILHKSLELCWIFLVIYIKYLFNNYYEFFSLYLIFYGFC